jgi:hypothetical protein
MLELSPDIIAGSQLNLFQVCKLIILYGNCFLNVTEPPPMLGLYDIQMSQAVSYSYILFDQQYGIPSPAL